jgi:proline iminopeptidase
LEGEAMPGCEGYVTMRDGVRLHYETSDGGTPGVVVPGGIVFRRDFAPLTQSHSVLFYDVRHRGRSDPAAEAPGLARGILDDLDDLEEVRRHFGIGSVAVIGHSYLAVLAALYALEHPTAVARVVQLGPLEPNPGHPYPAHLTGHDDVSLEVFARLEHLRSERGGADPVEFCRRFWSVLRLLYVTDAKDAHRADWGRCELVNERAFMRYWMEVVQPSLRALDLSKERLSALRAPVLTIHGTRDRCAPYAGGRDWAMRLGNARLLTVEGAGHAPWIEAPAQVFRTLETFLQGGWPQEARAVTSLEPVRL